MEIDLGRRWRQFVSGWFFLRQVVFCAVLVAGLNSCDPSNDSPANDQSATVGPPNASLRVVEGEWLIKFKSSTSLTSIKSALADASLAQRNSYRTIPGLKRVRLLADGDSTKALSLLKQRDDVEYIEPNFIVHKSATPNDPKFTDMWGLKSPGSFGGEPGADIAVVDAWDITTGSANVVIAVIDSGIDYLHEDLAANIFTNAADCDADSIDDDGNGYVDDCHGIDTANDDTDPMDDDSHGTHVAGTIGAVGNNGIGTVGVAWQVRLLPCKFLDESGNGSTAAAIECLDYIAMLRDRGVNVVASNNSWGGITPSRALHDAIVTQRQRNILFITAAGNARSDVDEKPEFPCNDNASNVICVGGSSLDNNRDIYSNWGAHAVAVQAPGASIWSTVPDNKYDVKDGTSMAAPHVSGVVALLATQDSTRDWRAIKNLVIASADPYVGPYPQYNAPHLNASAALTCTSATVRKRLQPAAFETMIRPVGAHIVLTALNITCDKPAGGIGFTIAPTGEIVSLKDDGLGSDEVSGDGVYTGVWTTSSPGEFTLTLDAVPGDPIQVIVDATLKPGFPLPMNISSDRSCYIGGGNFGITVGNVLGDDKLEIVATGSFLGPLYAWTHEGALLPGWPVHDSCSPTTVGLGELDGDTSHIEIGAVVAGRMLHYSPLGIAMPGWPQNQQQAYFPPAFVDLNGDGRDEMIGFPSRYMDGTPIDGLMPLNDGGFDGPAAIADLDSDGRQEIIVVGSRRIWAGNSEGALFGFPVRDVGIEGRSSLEEGVVGDVDGDGELEIIFPKHTYVEANQSVLIYSHNGRFERSLPVSGQLTGKPVLADLDSDGIPEILVAGHRELYAFKGNGSLMPGWPVTFPDPEFYPSYPIVGDVMGNGNTNVVVTVATTNYLDSGAQQAKLYVFDPNGDVVQGFPRRIGMTDGTLTSAIADLDRDGRNELLFTSAFGNGVRDNLFAHDFSRGPTGPIEWGTYRGGTEHRGFYQLGKNLSQRAYVTAHTHGAGTISTGDGRISCGSDCIELYDKGANVVLTASPAPGAYFEQWVGDCAGQANPCTLNVQRYFAATARFHSPLHVEVVGSGTVVSAPGISCPSDCDEGYPGDSVVTLAATPANGWDFDGWSGACSGIQLQCSVQIDAAKNIVAKFVTARRVSVAKSGGGVGKVISEPIGIDCGGTCAADFPADSTVKLIAQPAPGSYFRKWSGACDYFGPECTVTADAERSVVAQFEISPVLIVARVGTGTGRIMDSPRIDCGTRCSMEGQAPVTAVVLVASPDRDSEFAGWLGDCSTIISTLCIVTLDSDKSVTGRFILRPWLTVNWTGVGGLGTVTSSAGNINCGQTAACEARFDQHAQVILTAQLNPGAFFIGWSGACSGNALTCNVTMDAAKSVTANFGTSPPPPPSPPSADSGGGSSGGGAFDLELLAALLLVLRLRAVRNPRRLERH